MKKPIGRQTSCNRPAACEEFNHSELLSDTRQHYAATSGGKVTNGLPTSAYHVHHARNTGWPTWGDPYGHGVPIVVGDGESPSHPNSSVLGQQTTGEGAQVSSISGNQEIAQGL
jgi:hypothetical protein